MDSIPQLINVAPLFQHWESVFTRGFIVLNYDGDITVHLDLQTIPFESIDTSKTHLTFSSQQTIVKLGGDVIKIQKHQPAQIQHTSLTEQMHQLALSKQKDNHALLTVNVGDVLVDGIVYAMSLQFVCGGRTFPFELPAVIIGARRNSYEPWCKCVWHAVAGERTSMSAGAFEKAFVHHLTQGMHDNNIKRDFPPFPIKEIRGFEETRELQFTDFVNCMKDIDSRVAVVVKHRSLWEAGLIHGHIKTEDADQKLMKYQSGTFLIRFGSHANKLVISFKTDDGATKHTLLVAEHLNYFPLENIILDSLALGNILDISGTGKEKSSVFKKSSTPTNVKGYIDLSDPNLSKGFENAKRRRPDEDSSYVERPVPSSLLPMHSSSPHDTLKVTYQGRTKTIMVLPNLTFKEAFAHATDKMTDAQKKYLAFFHDGKEIPMNMNVATSGISEVMLEPTSF